VDDLLSEKEQIEQFRSWWSEYGGYVIGGLGLGIALLAGFNYYNNSKLEAQLQGSALYQTLAEHVVSGSLEEAQAVANELGTDYASTVYSAQAKLAMARLYMDKNRDQDAADALGELIASGADEAVKHVARARLARILLYQGKAQEVVDLLEGQESAAFSATYNELLGDAYRELGRIEDAEAAYQSVLLDPMSQGTVDQQLVQWKALDLPAASAEAAVGEEAAAAEPAAEDVATEDPAVADPAVEESPGTGEAKESE
jgi:predicted negative regulator of RcsB-dependent stress response